MKTEVGELVVGSYLTQVELCDFVQYNVRPRGGGRKGLGELDVLGLDLENHRAYLCEVTTHLDGLLYDSYARTIELVAAKHARQREYAEESLAGFSQVSYSLWSPVVPVGVLTEGLKSIDGLELVINGEYAYRVEKLRAIARGTKHDVGNDFFRALQILEHLRPETS